MKKLILTAFAVTLMLVGTSAVQYQCTTSSGSSQNTGFCKALRSGNGDMCFNYGPGTACNGTIVGQSVGG